jgi:hypothetical protein
MINGQMEEQSLLKPVVYLVGALLWYLYVCYRTLTGVSSILPFQLTISMLLCE